MDNYEDIIGLPHHVTEKHKPMPIEKRAAQFSPFAALTGYEDAVDEEFRLTDSRHEADEDRVSRINRCLDFLAKSEYKGVTATVVYFCRDSRKEGGAYLTFTGLFRYLETSANLLCFEGGVEIPVKDIFDINVSEIPAE